MSRGRDPRQLEGAGIGRGPSLQHQRQAGGDKDDAIGEGRDLLIETPCVVTEPAAERRLGHEAHADLVGDQHDRARRQPQCRVQRLGLLVDGPISEQQVGEPQGQAIDQQRPVTRRLGGDDRGQRQRLLDGPPERRAAGAMLADAQGHLGIAGFRRRAIGAADSGVFDQCFGPAALAGTCAAQHQCHRGKPDGCAIHARQRQRLLLRPRNCPGLSDAEVSWLGVVARGAFPAGPSPEPVAFAARSPLTVAGAAPVFHRTSLSHRGDDASTGAPPPLPLVSGGTGLAPSPCGTTRAARR